MKNNTEINLQHSGGLSSGPLNSAALPGWKDALPTALPFLLVSLSGMLILFQGLGWLNPDSLVGKAVFTNFTIILAITAIGVLFYAWRMDWPRWSASWSIFWFLGLFMLLTGIPTSLWEPSPSFYTFLQPLLWVILALAAAYFLYRLFRRDTQLGLLAALPAMGIPWMSFNEYVPDTLEGTITTLSWLILAGAAVLILRSNRLSTYLAVALGAIALIGLPYAYEGIYEGGALNFDAPGPSPIQVLRAFLPYLVATSTAAIGPLFARFLYRLGLYSGELGRRIYRLPLLGLLLMLIANLLTLTAYTNDGWRILWPGHRLVLSILNCLGIAIFTASFIGLLLAARRKATLVNLGALVLFYLLALLLPGMPLMILRYGFNWPITVQFYEVGYFYRLPEFTVYGLGFLWMLVSAWMAVYLNVQAPKRQKTPPNT